MGCGWLGQALGVYLISKGYTVRGSTTSRDRLELLSNLGIEPSLISIGDTVDTEANRFFDSEILIVAIPPKRKSGSSDRYVQQMKMLEQYLRGAAVKNLIFVSSTSIYPDVPKEVTEEDADPNSYLYECETLFLECSFIHTTVVRFGGLIGPGRHPGKFLAGKTEIKGRLHPVNLIHQQDCAVLIEKVIALGMWGQVLNGCSHVHMTREAYYTAASMALGLEPPQFTDDQSNSKEVNVSRTEQLLNFKFSDELVLAFLKRIPR